MLAVNLPHTTDRTLMRRQCPALSSPLLSVSVIQALCQLEKSLRIIIYLYRLMANDLPLRPDCSCANAQWWTPFLEPGAFATSAGKTEQKKVIDSRHAGSLRALLVSVSPSLFSCLEIADEDEMPLASLIELLMCISILSPKGHKEAVLHSLSSSLLLWLHNVFPSSLCFLFFFSVTLVLTHCYASLFPLFL